MKTASLLTAFLALAFALPGRADPLDERLEKLRLMLAEAAAKAEAVTGDDRQRQRMVAETLRRGVEMLLPEAGEGLGNALRQIGAAAPAEAKAEADALLRDLPKLSEERADRTITVIEELVKKVAPACLTAKTEAELDPLLRDLGRAARISRNGREDPRLSRSSRKLSAAERAVTLWQDYLAQLAAGNVEAGGKVLRSIGEQSDYPIIPQPEIARRLAVKGVPSDDAEALRLLRESKTLDDLVEVVGKLNVRLAGQPAATSSYFATLKGIASAHVALRHGFVGEALRLAKDEGLRFQGPENAEDWDAQMARFRGLLQLALVPRYLDAANNSAPAAGEDASAYVLRLATELTAARHLPARRLSRPSRRTALDRGGYPWLEGVRRRGAALSRSGFRGSDRQLPARGLGGGKIHAEPGSRPTARRTFHRASRGGESRPADGGFGNALSTASPPVSERVTADFGIAAPARHPQPPDPAARRKLTP